MRRYPMRGMVKLSVRIIELKQSLQRPVHPTSHMLDGSRINCSLNMYACFIKHKKVQLRAPNLVLFHFLYYAYHHIANDQNERRQSDSR